MVYCSSLCRANFHVWLEPLDRAAFGAGGLGPRKPIEPSRSYWFPGRHLLWKNNVLIGMVPVTQGFVIFMRKYLLLQTDLTNARPTVSYNQILASIHTLRLKSLIQLCR
ncbi:hypothetical protein ABKN59_010418 [Abortiporus biennis]